VLVVGQEQDARGGKFSSSESYVGQIHGLNVWDYALSSAEIQRLASSCGHLGNVAAWPDLLAGINGHVQQLNTSFCAGMFHSDPSAEKKFSSWFRLTKFTANIRLSRIMSRNQI